MDFVRQVQLGQQMLVRPRSALVLGIAIALPLFVLTLVQPQPDALETNPILGIENDESSLEVVSADIARESSERWVRKLRDAGSVRFQAERPSSTSTSFTMQPLEGPLAPSEKATLLAKFDAAVYNLSTRRAELSSSLDPTDEDDILAEAALERSLSVYDAARRMISADEYILVESGAKLAQSIPDGLVMAHNIVSHQGRKADAVLYIRFDEHPALKQASEYAEQVDGYWRRCKAEAFNALPEEERRRRIAAHDSVPARLRSPPSEIASDPTALEEWKGKILRDRLPNGLIIDRDRILAIVPDRAR